MRTDLWLVGKPPWAVLGSSHPPATEKNDPSPRRDPPASPDYQVQVNTPVEPAAPPTPMGLSSTPPGAAQSAARSPASSPVAAADTPRSSANAAPPVEQPTSTPPVDEKLVQRYLVTGRARREAERRLDAEERPPVMAPRVLTLRERLTQPQPPTRYRAKGWAIVNGRTLLTAQAKAGKTTLVVNLARSLVTGEPFLGVAEVTPLDGPLLVIDAEMSPTQLDQWYREHGMEHEDRVLILSLRGKLGAFNILDPTVRAQWAVRFRALDVRYVVLDCLRPFFDALGLDELHDAGKFLVPFDALLAEADIPEALLVHHMGHGGERARGDSRFLDWPDTIWRLVRQSADPTSGRYLAAFGRDVDVPEGKLAYNPVWRQLTLNGGSRHDADVEQALADALDTLAKGEQPSFNKLVDAVKVESRESRDNIRGAIKLGIKKGRILIVEGPRKALIHRLAPPPSAGGPA